MKIRSYSLAVTLQTIALVICSWAAGQAGLLSSLDGWSYDFLLKLTPRDHPSEQAILIEVPRHQNNSVYWQSLIDELKQFPVKKLVVPYPNTHMPNDQAIVYAKHSEYDGSELSFSALNNLPKPNQGIYRGFDQRDLQLAETHPALTWLPVFLAQQLTGQLNQPPRFWLDFRLVDTGIPKVSSQAILEHRISAELLSEKVVFIGLQQDPSQPLLYTSNFADGRPITPIAFQLVATQTLLNEGAIYPINSALQLVVILVWCVICLLAYRNISKNELWLSIGFTSTTILLSWFLLQFSALWLPLTEMLTVQFLAFFLVHRVRQVQERDSIDQFLFSHRTMMRKHVENASFFDADQHWFQLINMVNQTLNMNRLIFLERVERDHRIKEIAALNCNIKDITELRRDYERTPYSTALQLNRPLILQKTYLGNRPEDEVQVLVPLTFAGEIMGFWAFGIQQNNLDNIPNFMNIVDDYGKQIAELLFQRKHWQEQKEEQNSLINRYLSFDHSRSRFLHLEQVVETQHRRLNLFESVFEESTNAVMLYDLFGRVSLINRSMENLLQQQNLAGFEFTALDMMHKLSLLSIERCRSLLQQVVQQQRELKFLIELGDESYELRISALLHAESAKGFESQTDHPFELQGILFELKSMSGSKERQSNHVRLVKHLFHLIQNDLESIFLASTLLSGSDTEEERSAINTILATKRGSLNDVLKKAWFYLRQQEQFQEADMLYPIDTCHVIGKILAQYDNAALTKKKLKVQTEFIEYSELGMLDPAAMTALINNFMDILVEDATLDSTIYVRFKEHEKALLYQFSNQGFGLPEERLAQLLQEQESQSSENFAEFRYAISQVNSWGGRLSIKSQLGKGIRITLAFKRFS